MPVKLNISPSVYGSDAIVLNPQPYVNYAMRAQAQKAARNEAFLKSYQDMSSKLTPTGMSGDDVDALTQKKNEWMNYINENEKAYKNPSIDGGKAYMTAMGLYNDALNIIQTSKDKVENNARAFPVMSDPKRSALVTQDFHDRWAKANLPVNKGYQRLDLSTLNFNDAPFDADQMKKFGTNIKSVVANSLKNKIYGTSTVDKATNTKITPYTIELTDQDKQNVRANAMIEARTNPSFSNFLEDALANHGEAYNAYNQVYKNNFGDNANIESTDDMATAIALSQISSDLHGEERSPYTDVLGNFDYMQDKRNQEWFSHYNYSLEHPRSDPQSESDATDNYIYGMINNGINLPYKRKDGTQVNRLVFKPDQKLQSEFGVYDGSTLVRPDQIAMEPDGKIAVTFYQTNPDTKQVDFTPDGKAAVDLTKSYTLDSDTFKKRVAKAIYGVKEAKKVSSGGGVQQPKQGAGKKKVNWVNP